MEHIENETVHLKIQTATFNFHFFSSKNPHFCTLILFSVTSHLACNNLLQNSTFFSSHSGWHKKSSPPVINQLSPRGQIPTIKRMYNFIQMTRLQTPRRILFISVWNYFCFSPLCLPLPQRMDQKTLAPRRPID